MGTLEGSHTAFYLNYWSYLMPIYTFVNTETGEQIEEMMKEFVVRHHEDNQ